MKLLDLGFVRRVRQSHAVEHATITLLMARQGAPALVGGRSNARGFYIFGEVETGLLEAVAREALARLQRGEAELAIHPNCGTNLAATGVMAGLASLAATGLGRRRGMGMLDHIAAVVTSATAAVIASRPVGLRLQRQVTTLADVGNREVATVHRRQLGQIVVHFVSLRSHEQP